MPAFHAFYTKFRACHLNVATEIETTQTRFLLYTISNLSIFVIIWLLIKYSENKI